MDVLSTDVEESNLENIPDQFMVRGVYYGAL